MSRKIIVDGSNVAHEEQTDDGRPRMANLIAMRRAIEDAGDEPTIIVDATLRHQIDDADQLEALLDDKRIYQAPAGTAADAFVLMQAQETGARYVSNDTYASYGDEYDWLAERRVPYMIIDGRVLIDTDKAEA